MKITGYEAICNLGNNINSIYKKAIVGDITCFDYSKDIIKNKTVRIGQIKCELPKIKDCNFNLRCNRLILKNLELLKNDISALYKKYSKNKIGIIVATTNTGVSEYEQSKNKIHSELGNPSNFIKKILDLKGFNTTLSTACSSGIKAFILADELLNSNVSDCVIIACVDTLSKVPVFGFNSLEVLSDKPSLPFSKNRMGMNIAEASSIFILEKESDFGIKILGLAESSDIYHPTTPDPNAIEAIKAIKSALKIANIKANEIDYINAHGTGTIANDIMEAKAIYSVFSDNVPVSSTKPTTGHCLGAGGGIETALCAKLLDSFDGRLYPNIYDEEFDNNLDKINLVQKDKIYSRCKIIMNNSFGFGGSNAIMIMGKNDEK